MTSLIESFTINNFQKRNEYQKYPQRSMSRPFKKIKIKTISLLSCPIDTISCYDEHFSKGGGEEKFSFKIFFKSNRDQ